MERTHGYVIVTVRVLGLAGVVMGVIWLINLATMYLLFAMGAPPDVLNPVYSHALRGVVSGPLLLIAGVFALRKSASLAAFVLKGAKDSAA